MFRHGWMISPRRMKLTGGRDAATDDSHMDRSHDGELELGQDDKQTRLRLLRALERGRGLFHTKNHPSLSHAEFAA